jgi:hypothetical protein
MTPQDLATDAKQRRTMEASFRRASERYENSPDGMRDKAKGLRDRARDMSNPGDRTLMLRLASGFEARAEALDKQPRGIAGTAKRQTPAAEGQGGDHPSCFTASV